MTTTHPSSRIKMRVAVRDGGICQYCGREASLIEHVIPSALGGHGTEYNLVASCVTCNVRKGRTTWIPRNFETIVAGNEEWRERVLSAAVFDSRSGDPIPRRVFEDSDLGVTAEDWVAARESFGETQAEFAKRIGVSRAFIAMLETGKRKPRELLVRQLHAVLDGQGV